MKGQPLNLTCITPMTSALRGRVTNYQPEFPGLDLDRENQDAQISVANLRRLFGEGMTLAGIVAGPAGLLFNFDSGEQYLATGLRVGPNSGLLAGLLAELGFGTEAELKPFYAAMSIDYWGPVPLG
jgi:hypothetical protein